MLMMAIHERSTSCWHHHVRCDTGDNGAWRAGRAELGDSQNMI